MVLEFKLHGKLSSLWQGDSPIDENGRIEASKLESLLIDPEHDQDYDW